MAVDFSIFDHTLPAFSAESIMQAAMQNKQIAATQQNNDTNAVVNFTNSQNQGQQQQQQAQQQNQVEQQKNAIMQQQVSNQNQQAQQAQANAMQLEKQKADDQLKLKMQLAASANTGDPYMMQLAQQLGMPVGGIGSAAISGGTGSTGSSGGKSNLANDAFSMAIAAGRPDIAAKIDAVKWAAYQKTTAETAQIQSKLNADKNGPIPEGGIGKLTQVSTSAKFAPLANHYMFSNGDPLTGDVNWGNVANSSMPFGGTPKTEGRDLNTALEQQIQSVLRSETGAQINESEKPMIAQAFRPSILDTDTTIRAKMLALQDFQSNYIQFSGKDGYKALALVQQHIGDLENQLINKTLSQRRLEKRANAMQGSSTDDARAAALMAKRGM